MVRSTKDVWSLLTSITTIIIVVQTVLYEIKRISEQFIPKQVRERILWIVNSLVNIGFGVTTLSIDEFDDYLGNEIYNASATYLSTIITPSSCQNLKVFMNTNFKRTTKGSEKNMMSLTLENGEKIRDVFNGSIVVVWEFIATTSTSPLKNGSSKAIMNRTFKLSFKKKYLENVVGVGGYLSYVLEKAKAINEERKVVQLFYKLHDDYHYTDGNPWLGIDFDHPSTFQTLAMDEGVKEELILDLERFLDRKEFYKSVGKAWKRGYLLYGPPGTGKSSLIAAMANYLKFDIYDLQLSTIRKDSNLRNLLLSTSNRSILVVEDIDCSTTTITNSDQRLCMQPTNYYSRNYNDKNELTLSGLLNFIDGLWSNCGDERIIVFTTNHKERLDPALLRPGRMDMHINMSYCTYSAFKTLALNYLHIQNHYLFQQIQNKINHVNVTPAEVAEELMRTHHDDVDQALQRLLLTLNSKPTSSSSNN
ncbi:AAA-ATPase At3g50940-like [Cannabis sativa]|uniref:AAA-ATPase At3g50940-like n=1 Tax=Cannabis sativa TaxID=3483 RepID=UPI0029C9B512|nr:AAA-ATPase At3g50940-like [Cannabis sativa]